MVLHDAASLFEGILKFTFGLRTSVIQILFFVPIVVSCSHPVLLLSFKAPPRITAVQPGENGTEAVLTNAQLKC